MIYLDEQSQKISPKELGLPEFSSDSIVLLSQLQAVALEKRKQGYFLFSVDSLFKKDETWITRLHVGEKAESIKLFLDQTEKTPFQLGRRREFTLSQWEKVKKNVIRHFNSKGYPFFSIKFEDWKVENGRLMAGLHIDFDKRYYWDSLDVKEEWRIKRWYLEKWLGIEQGKPFSQRVVENLSNRKELLPFLKMLENPEVDFDGNKAKINLKATYVPSNEIDALIGLQPGNGTQRNALFGKVNLSLFNPFKTGKYIGFKWQRLRQDTQELDLEYRHPFIFRSDYSLKAGFNLYRQDSTFLTVSSFFSVGKRISLNASWDIAIRTFSGNEISNGTDTIENPDVSVFSGGFSYLVDLRDAAFFPTRGFMLKSGAFLGRRREEIGRTLIFGDALLEFQKPIRLAEKIAWVSQINGGIKEIEGEFTLKELYRIGGLNTLRGFNEQQFFVYSFLVFTNEWRLKAGENSYLFTFADIGRISGNSGAETPFGTGVGLNLRVTTGNFQLVYSIGKSSQQEITLQNARIHFGFKAKF